MAEAKCPKEKLEFLVLALPEIVFETLSLEPNRGLIEEIAREQRPEMTDEELEERYRDFLKIYDETQQTATELFKWGNTREEIFQNIREHVRGCLDCSEKYLELLKEHALANINLKKSRYPAVREMGKRYEKEGFFRVLIDTDLKYLGLLKSTKE